MYKCNNCGHVAPRDEMKDAQDLLERMEVGDVFTDKECPECGALAHPVDEPDEFDALPEGDALSPLQACEFALGCILDAEELEEIDADAFSETKRVLRSAIAAHA